MTKIPASRGVSLLLLALLLYRCGGPETTNLAPDATKKTLENLPEWFLQPPINEEHLSAAASATSRDMQVAILKARNTAQADLAQQLETRMANLTRQFQEETGLGEDSELLTQFSSATKAVTNQTLNGVRTARDKLLSEKGIYRAYVLMELPLGKANQLLMDKIQSNQHLYTRFRATQAFEELDKELQSFAKQEER